MATLNLFTALEYTQDGVTYTVGSKTVPAQVTAIRTFITNNLVGPANTQEGL